MAVGSNKSMPDDAFYNNVTLGLGQFLNEVPRITNIRLEKQQPCERAQITSWEQRHNLSLPDDMKRFYLSTDGYTFHWSYQYATEDERRVGYLNFPHLHQITVLKEFNEQLLTPSVVKTPPNSGSSRISKPFKQNDIGLMEQLSVPQLNDRSKIFELSSIGDLAKVCLIYETPDIVNPKIFLLEIPSLQWIFLANNFTEYKRMAIIHLGLPYWELCFANCGLPPWVEQLFLLLAPHLLEKMEPRRNRMTIGPNDLITFNKLDMAIFRTKTKCSRQTQKIK